MGLGLLSPHPAPTLFRAALDGGFAWKNVARGGSDAALIDLGGEKQFLCCLGVS